MNRNTGNVGADVAYVHNAVGERLKKTVTPTSGPKSIQNMTWSALGRLTKLITVKKTGVSVETPLAAYDYRYRADGLRVAKIGGPLVTAQQELEEEQSSYWDQNLAQNKPTWRYAYDGQMPIFEDYKRYEGGQYEIYDVTRSTLGARGIDMIERQRMSDKENPNPGTASRVFPLYDGHGNTMCEIARSGNVFAGGNFRRFDAWGQSRAGVAPSGFHGYCGNLGHKEDPESGLTYMRARYYEPGTGRFISEDPAKDGINWYGYCGGNPVDRVDFTGKYWDALMAGVMSFLATLVVLGPNSTPNLVRTAIVNAIVTAVTVACSTALTKAASAGAITATVAMILKISAGAVLNMAATFLVSWITGEETSPIDYVLAALTGGFAGGISGNLGLTDDFLAAVYQVLTPFFVKGAIKAFGP